MKIRTTTTALSAAAFLLATGIPEALWAQRAPQIRDDLRPQNFGTPTITSVYGEGDGNDVTATGALSVALDSSTVPSNISHINLQTRRPGGNWPGGYFRTKNADQVYVTGNNRLRGHRYEARVRNCTAASPIFCGSYSSVVVGALRPAPVQSFSAVPGAIQRRAST